jgi:hypothetical protein
MILVFTLISTALLGYTVAEDVVIHFWWEATHGKELGRDFITSP